MRPTHLKSVTTPDGTAVLDLTSGTLTTLNPTGGYIWKALEDGLSEEEIVKRLAHDSDCVPEVVATDVRLFLADLRKKGLLAH